MPVRNFIDVPGHNSDIFFRLSCTLAARLARAKKPAVTSAVRLVPLALPLPLSQSLPLSSQFTARDNVRTVVVMVAVIAVIAVIVVVGQSLLIVALTGEL